MPRRPRPRLSRPRLPRFRLPRPPDAVIEACRVPVELGRDGWDWWLDLSIYTRRRLGVAAGLLATVALIWLVALPALPCRAPGGNVCPPSDHAIELVPDDALAYVHLNLDRDGDQLEAAQSVASRVPTLAQQAIGRLASALPGPNGASLDFRRDVEPWLGGEAALAILPAGGRVAQEVQLLRVGDEGDARKFASSIASGKPRASSYRGVEIQVDRRGLATAIVGGFLAIGTRGGVREVIDAQSGADHTGSLADDRLAAEARDALPDDRLADLYLSKDGTSRLVADPSSPLATLAAVVNPGASRGVAAALVASDQGLELDIRSILDPGRVPAHPGFFSVFPSFEPELAASLPPDSLGYLGIGDPGRAIGSLLGQASASEPGLAAALGGVAKGVKALEGVGLERQLAPALGGEAAFALAPSPRGGSRTPILIFVGSGIDEELATKALVRLQGPVAKALGSSRRAPAFSRQRVGGVTVHSLRLSSTLDLSYAIVDQALVIATDPAGVRALSPGGPGLDDADPFREATAGLPSEVSTLGYLDLGGLIAIAERAGLAGDPAYETFAPEIRRLRALGLSVQASSHELSTDIRLVVADDAGGSGGGSGGTSSD